MICEATYSVGAKDGVDWGARALMVEEEPMSAGRVGPDTGTTWDEVTEIWEEVREIVTTWADSLVADDREV